MGTEPVPHLHHGSISDGVWKRRPPNVHLKGWSFTCHMCDTVDLANTDANITAVFETQGEVAKSDITMTVPDRCSLCAKDKYAWQTRKRLQKTLPALANGHKASLHTYTIGIAEEMVTEHSDERYYELHNEMKHAFRRFTRSKWWRTRVSGMFYTIEVKRTQLPNGFTKLHPHVHAIVLHEKRHDFKKAAQERGLGDYTYVRRIRGGISRPINYILKYALKGYGDPMYQGRYYETTGVFRKSNKQVGDEADAASTV